MSNHYNPLILLTLLFCFQVSFSQDLHTSRTTGPVTLVFKLNEGQAEKYIRNGRVKKMDELQDQLFKILPVDSTGIAVLPFGQYLLLSTDRNNLVSAFKSVNQCEIKVLNNQRDLVVQVYDLKGELINDAIVKIGDTRMKYDHKMKVYRKSKTNQQGTLSVGFGGHTSYFEITRQHDNSRIKRIYRRIVYGTPLKYVARPVEFVLRIPFDAYRSIRHGYLAGTIYRLSHPFGSYYDLFDKLGCLFVRSSWCDLDHKYNGYFVTDKPKYKPGDTLKMKALIQTKKGKPKTDPLKLRLNNYRGEIKNVDLGWVYPTETGAYISRVVLHDSLQLGLDLWQNLQLIDEWGRSYMDGRFYYEEYELNNIYLNLRSNNTSHQRHDTVVVYAKANDDNDLPVPDGELFITITSREIYQYHADHVFVPDTLWTHRIKLETIGETKIILPDSIFPEASMSYIITGRLQTSDGKTETKELHLRNFSQNRLVHFDDHNDSLRVYMTEASKETTGTARVRVYHQDQEMPAAVFDMPLPGQVAMNPLSTKITVETASVQRSFSLQEVSPRLQISAVRTADSLYIEAINPRKIPFHWQLYYRNNPLQQGRGETLKINRKAKGRGEYFIAIQYLWANRPYSENYVVGFREKELNIAIEAPAIIVPGDEKEISISVKDQQNRAVEGVDLLAFGLTGKFKNFSTPPLPDYNKPVMTRKMINEFDNRPQSFDIKEKWLDYKAWKKQFGLDSVEYYRFIYPDSLYINRVKSPGNITQLAPFVMGGGRPLPVQVITIDHRPVYFSWAHNNRYAFRLDSGYHQLRLRTFAKEYVLDSFYVEHGKKNMVSFASDYEGQEVKQHKRKSKLKDGEKENYNTYVIRLRKDEYGLSYLQDGHNIHRLMNNSNYAQTYTIGPLYDRHFNYVIPEIHLYKDVEREPFYTYHFRPDRVKLTSYLPKTSGPRFSFSIPEYRDFVLTNRDIALELDQIKKDMLQDPSFYDDPGRKKQGLGELMLHYDSIALKGRGMPMVCMLRKTDEIGYFHVGPGKEVYFHNLKAGRYELVGLYYDSAYFKLGALEVREGGTNYFRVDSLNIAGHDMFWQETFDYLLKKATENYKTSAGSGKRYPRVESRVVREIYSNNYLFTQGNVVSGFVYDQEDELGIPGVAVMIKGTDRGVATDINGRYSITVPDGPCTLVYSFIGYVQIEEKRQGPGEVNVYMSPDVTQLEEVVVVGYGSQRMQNMTASVVTVSSALQGRVAGVEITGSKGTIQIRGVSSVSGANAPLIIVDGVPFAGDISKLDPSLIQQAEMLKDESLTAIYGARAANGVLLITTRTGTKSALQLAGAGNMADEGFPYSLEDVRSSIRNNFNDAAFWQPELVTDREGMATFRVKFPDDITRWDLHVMGVKGKFNGKATAGIRSFKPLSAQLALPAFLLEGDTSFVVGKSMNYTNDSLSVRTHFAINDRDTLYRDHRVLGAAIDSLALTPDLPGDTLEVRYMLEMTSGYFDGEERKVPVLPRGGVKRTGGLMVLASDTSLTLPYSKAKGPVYVNASARLSDVLVRQAEGLIRYTWECNEQLASKLLAYLALEKLEGTKKNEAKIKGLINKLENNQNKNGMWGWWGKSTHTAYWISNHVLYALDEAKKMDYQYRHRKEDAREYIIKNFGLSKDQDRIYFLKMLRMMDKGLNLTAFFGDMQAPDSMSTFLRFERMALDDRIKRKTLQQQLELYADTTTFGSVYWKDTGRLRYSPYRSDYMLTLSAWALLDKTGADKEKVVNYFIEEMKEGYWANTYQKSRILYVLACEMDGQVDPEEKKAGLQIVAGEETLEIEDFPYKGQFNQGKPLTVKKTGAERVFFSWYQEENEKDPQPFEKHFAVKTAFYDYATGREIMEFTRGEKVIMKVEFEARDQGEYVMVQAPIPAGCSYGKKEQGFWGVHREYRKEQVVVFYDRMARGKYSFEIELVPRFTGSYYVNPARAELMYFPLVYGANKVGKITIGGY